jgi:hypothetical protein
MFHKALLLTYTFDPVFFEQVVLPDLWAGRASDILVIGDKEQVKSSVDSAAGRLWHLGKRYLLAGSRHSGAFHPKVMLRLGQADGAVMIGSGNLTSCGWGGNRELGCAWTFGPNHADKGAWLQAFLDEVATWCASDLEREAVLRMKDIPWLAMNSSESHSPAPLLYSGGNQALATALARQWAGRRFSEVRILTGSTDESGAFLRWAHRTFGIERAVVALTLSQASFSMEKLADLPVDLSIIPVSASTPLHAKFYFFDGPEGTAALMGSPNCSAAAWLVTPDQGGNIETAVVYDTPSPEDFHDVLAIFESPSFSPKDVLTVAIPGSTEISSGECPYNLIGLRWDASSRCVMALISPCPEPGTAVLLVLGDTSRPMRAGGSSGCECWFSEVPEGIDFTAAAFGSVRLERDGQEWRTHARWIDHLAELRHSSQTARFLEPIRSLEDSASVAEQRRILDDLHQVAQALFSDSSTFRDSGFSVAPAALPDSEVTAPPVDPAALIKHLVETHDSAVHLGGAATGSMSLTGILRLLFDAESAVTAAESAVEDEKLDEGQFIDPNSAPTQKSKTAPVEVPTKTVSVDAKLQSRLAAQIATFLEKLSKPEFADSCSATQLIQAVCFPLAVALRGQMCGWVSAESAEAWGLRVVSILFRGNTTSSPGLLRAVERHYLDGGKSGIFREIVGEGTLWMALVATLGNSTWQGIGATLDKALAIREVFRAPELISSAEASRLTGLLGQLRIEDARSYLSVVAPETSRLLDSIEQEIQPVWELEARSQFERTTMHHVGDWLWRANVGWAICLADADSRDKLQVRLRGAETKVGAEFYVNVSELATRKHQLSELLVALRKLLGASVRTTEEILPSLQA